MMTKYEKLVLRRYLMRNAAAYEEMANRAPEEMAQRYLSMAEEMRSDANQLTGDDNGPEEEARGR